MSVTEPFVSVLTPFYNTDQYLAQCIESVLGQTYRNFEYVLVDNQSTDGSGAIAAEYARRDSRIRLIRADQFRIQIQNYNYAIGHISESSRYLKFAQADDWLYPRCLTEMVDLAESNPNVAVVSSYDLRGNEVYGSGLTPDQRVLSGREAARLYFLQWLFLFGSQTTVLYRGDLVRSRTPFFEEHVPHPDTQLIFQVLADHDFGFVHQVLSFTRRSEDSITGRLRGLSDNPLDRLIVVKRFGRLYLKPREYEECRRGTLRWYYDDLGRRWIAQRLGKPSEEFWKFHREGLATIGETIQWPRVLQAAGRIVIENLLNPGRLILKLRGDRIRSGTSTPPHKS